jgi:2'-5' RNA ligase
MRVFIAIDINDQVRASIRALQSELKKAADIRRKEVKWVEPDNIHLTLKFLGEIKDSEVPDVCKIVESAADRHRGFELSVESVGHFGGRSARILWVGISEGRQALCQLQEELEGEMEKGGWSKEERPFTGHLTVCRIKNIKAGQRIAEISADYKDFKAGSVLVDSVKVYQSQLMPKGPIYSVLGSFLLQ